MGGRHLVSVIATERRTDDREYPWIEMTAEEWLKVAEHWRGPAAPARLGEDDEGGPLRPRTNR